CLAYWPVFHVITPRPPSSTLFPYTTLFRSVPIAQLQARLRFRAVAGSNFVLLAGTSLLSVGFALAGFGAYSFVLPWPLAAMGRLDRKSTRLNSSHLGISYAVFCLKKKNIDH